MRVFVHDYSGHPFPVQLSRELARRGHEVRHAWFASFQAPKGALAPRADDAPGLTFAPLDLGEPFAKYSFVRRWWQERAYGGALARAIAEYRPDVVLCGNAPLDPQAAALAACRRRSIPFVYWHQDVYGIAIDKILRRKLPLVGALIGWRYLALERRLLCRSDHVITISDDFLPILAGWGVRADSVSVIENWGPLDELPQRPRDNPWALQHGLGSRLVFLYAGTMGLKHNPELLLRLAQRLAPRGDASVVVVSEGLGAEWLQARAGEAPNLRVLKFETFERVPDVIASADVLVAVLEPDAGRFSVPSKVLAYFCAGRPILAAIPAENLAARLISRIDAGLVAPPDDPAVFVAAAERLAGDAALRARLGKNGLDYARRTFDIGAIGDRFEAILKAVSKH